MSLFTRGVSGLGRPWHVMPTGPARAQAQARARARARAAWWVARSKQQLVLICPRAAAKVPDSARVLLLRHAWRRRSGSSRVPGRRRPCLKCAGGRYDNLATEGRTGRAVAPSQWSGDSQATDRSSARPGAGSAPRQQAVTAHAMAAAFADCAEPARKTFRSTCTPRAARARGDPGHCRRSSCAAHLELLWQLEAVAKLNHGICRVF